MSRTSGLEFMKLLGEQGREIKAAFLPLDADFWNHELTGYTAFLDPGRVKLERNETEWRFVPDAPWKTGEHNLVIFPILEDAAGNRVDGAFEVDMFNEIDKAGKQERYLLAFKVAR